MTFDEFFDYVEAYWAQADEHEGFRTAPGTPMMLRAIRASQPSVETRPDDKNAANRPYKSGYLPERRLLWIRRAELTRLAKTIGMPDYARDFVNETGVFIRLTTAFAMSGNIDSPDQRGVVLVGKSDEGKTSKEILWIGITNELDIARLTLEERAARLRSPISRYPARERLGWVRHVDLDNTIPSFGRDVLRDVAAELLKAELTPVASGVALLPAQEGFGERPAIWFPPSGTDELVAVLGDGSRIVYVVGTKSFDELRGIITDFLTAHSAAARNRFVVVDRERLADELSHYPWLWSKHFGNDNGIQIIAPGDEDRRRTVALTGPFADVPPVPAWLRPNLRSALKTSARLVGEPGSGKTTAIVSLLWQTEQPVIWVSGGYRDDEMLVSLVHDFKDAVVVIDDFGWQRDIPEHQSPLARIIRLRRSGASIRIILSYWTSEAADIERRYAHTFRDAQLPDPIDLDHPDRDFLAYVARVAASAWAITADDVTIERIVEFIKRGPDNPHALVTYLRSFAGGTLRVPAGAEAFVTWQEKLAMLARSDNDSDRQRAIFLKVLAILRLLDFHGVPVELAAACFAAAGGSSFAATLAALQEEYWIALRNEYLYADDIQLDLRNVGFSLFTGELRTIVEVLLNRPELLTPARRRVALRKIAVGKLIAGFTTARLGDDTRSLAMSAWRAEFPDDSAPLDN